MAQVKVDVRVRTNLETYLFKMWYTLQTLILLAFISNNSQKAKSLSKYCNHMFFALKSSLKKRRETIWSKFQQLFICREDSFLQCSGLCVSVLPWLCLRILCVLLWWFVVCRTPTCYLFQPVSNSFVFSVTSDIYLGSRFKGYSCSEWSKRAQKYHPYQINHNK